MSDLFNCKTVVMRRIPDSLSSQALRSDVEGIVDCVKARQQWEEYLKIFRDDLKLKVLVLEADEQLPDCVFVEDIAVVVGRKALITNTGHHSRRNERYEMQKALRGIPELEMLVMSEVDERAVLDGGDVLFTGDEILVGLSSRSNEAGHQVLREMASPIPVVSVPVPGVLHLKSVCTLAEPGKLLVSVENEKTRAIYQNIKSLSTGKYEFIEVKGQMRFANCVYCVTEKGAAIIYPPEAKQVYEQLSVPNKFECDLSELAKVDGSLTCPSLLISL